MNELDTSTLLVCKSLMWYANFRNPQSSIFAYPRENPRRFTGCILLCTPSDNCLSANSSCGKFTLRTVLSRVSREVANESGLYYAGVLDLLRFQAAIYSFPKSDAIGYYRVSWCKIGNAVANQKHHSVVINTQSDFMTFIWNFPSASRSSLFQYKSINKGRLENMFI